MQKKSVLISLEQLKEELPQRVAIGLEDETRPPVSVYDVPVVLQVHRVATLGAAWTRQGSVVTDP